jgi:LPS export ABC transporter protein LptC
MSRTRTLLLLLLIGLAALWLARLPLGALTQRATGNVVNSTLPGFEARGATLTDTDDEGHPRYQLRAASIVQPAPGAGIELERPLFTDQAETTWTVAAERGLLDATGNHLDLLGDVRATATRSGRLPLLLRADAMTATLDERRIETASPVKVEWGVNRLWAAGLQASLRADTLKLLSPIHGEFPRH